MELVPLDFHLIHKSSPEGTDPHGEGRYSHPTLISIQYQNILWLWLLSYACEGGPLVFPSLF